MGKSGVHWLGTGRSSSGCLFGAQTSMWDSERARVLNTGPCAHVHFSPRPLVAAWFGYKTANVRKKRKHAAKIGYGCRFSSCLIWGIQSPLKLVYSSGRQLQHMTEEVQQHLGQFSTRAAATRCVL